MYLRKLVQTDIQNFCNDPNIEIKITFKNVPYPDLDDIIFPSKEVVQNKLIDGNEILFLLFGIVYT
jgi:hypothetical protein